MLPWNAEEHVAKVLVIGATGKVGTAAVRELRKVGADVRSLVRDRMRASSLEDTGAELALGDLEQPETLGDAFAGIESVILSTAASPLQQRHHLNAIRAAKEAGVRHVVRVSVTGASALSPVMLSRLHAASEHDLEQSGLAWTHLRPRFFMQNTIGYAAPIAATDGKFFACLGDLRLPMIDVRDIAAVAARCVTTAGHEGKTYDLTGPESLSFYDVAEKLTAASGRKITYVPVSAEAHFQEMVRTGFPEWLARDLILFFSPGILRSETTSAVRDVTGRDAASFDEFAREHASIFRMAGAAT